MKMVAAAKYARAERALKPARVYGTGSLGKFCHVMLTCIAQLSDFHNFQIFIGHFVQAYGGQLLPLPFFSSVTHVLLL